VWLLDTAALSETAKVRANPGFLAWVDQVADHDVHTSVLCLGEIRRGVEMLETGDKRDRLARWLERDLPDWLGPRVLGVDDDVAQVWGRLGARGSVSPIDALIGATAVTAGLTIVTRNVRDFDGLGVPVVNPWT
jgi:predicted nucleic acid-binding protein